MAFETDIFLLANPEDTGGLLKEVDAATPVDNVMTFSQDGRVWKRIIDGGQFRAAWVVNGTGDQTARLQAVLDNPAVKEVIFDNGVVNITGTLNAGGKVMTFIADGGIDGGTINNANLNLRINPYAVTSDTVGCTVYLYPTSDTNIYNSNGTLNDNRYVNLNGYILDFSGDLRVAGGLTLGTGGTASWQQNVAFGISALSTVSSGFANIGIGWSAARFLTTANCNTIVGSQSASLNTITGSHNSVCGQASLMRVTTGSFNTIMGSASGQQMTTAERNTIIGSHSATSLVSGVRNVIIGVATATSGPNGDYNTFIGAYAATSANGSRNVFIGYNAGANNFSTANDTLIIHNSNDVNPLVLGDFAARTMKFNGTLSVRDVALDNSGDKLIVWNSTTGLFSYREVSSISTGGGSYTASNGLTMSGSNIKLGGALTENTLVDGAGTYSFSMWLLTNLYLGADTTTIARDDGKISYSQVFNGAAFYNEFASTYDINNAPQTSIQVRPSLSTGTMATGFGGSIDFYLRDAAGAAPLGGNLGESVRLIGKWSDLTNKKASFEVWTRPNNTNIQKVLTLDGDGRASLHKYGVGTFAGTGAYALGVDSSGNLVEITTSASVFADKSTLSPATFYGPAYEVSSSSPLRDILRVGHATNNSLRSITINAVYFVSQSNFAGTAQWVQIATISDSNFRPNHTIYFEGPVVVDATKYGNSSGTAFTGSANYGSMTLRIDSNGAVFVYISSVSSYPQLSGSNIVVIPINVTYFLQTIAT